MATEANRHTMGGRIEGAENRIFHFAQVADDEAKLEDLSIAEVDQVDAALAHRTPGVAEGVDLTTLRAIDPQFDVEGFRAIARETFYKVRQARTDRNPNESAALLSAAMQTTVASEIAGDVAAHRTHVAPGLTCTDAVITAAGVSAGREEIDCRFSVTWGVDSATTRTWNERWHFQRDPSVDSAATDEQHELEPSHDGWIVAHRGWIVNAIERLN